MKSVTLKNSPFDDKSADLNCETPPEMPGPGQFSLSAIALITFDVAFVLGWCANANTHSRFGEDMGEYANRVLGSTLRIGIISFPIWTGVIAFFPALLGAALGSCAHVDIDHRRRVRGASLFWTLLSAMVLEWLIQWGLLVFNVDGDAKLLFFAFGNIGWSGLGLVFYWIWLTMISAGYGLVISLILALLGRWKMIPLAAPWKDAPWKAMWSIGLYGPYVWLVGFLLWVLAGKPELLAL
jgi:hypothetical protein